ncbi:MAG: class II aldolase/adducin family protein, partial [Candidatus Omnitrophica bacterium]|nr:class II aldolase/adducin family protein [Candidatus Omnitrophota bacterium]
MKKSIKIQRLLAQYSCKIARKHLVMGAMGNISLCIRGEVWIKRGGVWMEQAKPSDFIRVNVKNRGLVSKEINLHLGCYEARPDIGAVIHTHPFIITAMGTVLAKRKRLASSMGLGTPSDISSSVAIIKYYQPGSKALAKAVSKAIKKADCVIMANHGLVVVGRSLKEAYKKTVKLEVDAGKLLAKSLRG